MTHESDSVSAEDNKLDGKTAVVHKYVVFSIVLVSNVTIKDLMLPKHGA